MNMNCTNNLFYKFKCNFFKVFLFCILLGIIGCTNLPFINNEPSNGLNSDVKILKDSDSGLPFVNSYSEKMPSDIRTNIKYKGELPDILNYVFVKTKTINVRQKPNSGASVIEQYIFYDILQLEGSVMSGSSLWYKVKTPTGKIGYVYSGQVEKRVFRFNKGLEKVENVVNFVNDAIGRGAELAVINSYIPDPNHSNRNKKSDKYGTTNDQSIEGRYNGEIIYVPDRTIVEVLSRNGNTTRIRVASIAEPYLDVNSNAVRTNQNLKKNPINKAIAVDIENQNMVIFEKISGQWTIVSYARTKSGLESTLGFESPRGAFLAPMAKFEMLYNGEIGEKQGYAKYAIRFSGGGYLHGTPIGYEEEISKEYFVSLKEWTLGKFAGTRKCFRTEEEHAKFLFNWVLNDKINRSSNDQLITDNVLFVVF